MKSLNLPDPIAAYFEADRLGAEAVARCFTTDGRVTDEGQTHEGTLAIKAWKDAAAAQYAYVVTPCAVVQHDHEIIVTSRVTGNFPGSPVDLRYTFTLERGRISRLAITS